LRPNGFTPAKTFHDFPIRGQEVLLHVRRRRWLDTENHNVMSEFDFMQESTRRSKELADFLKVHDPRCGNENQRTYAFAA
jgi:transposase